MVLHPAVIEIVKAMAPTAVEQLDALLKRKRLGTEDLLFALFASNTEYHIRNKEHHEGMLKALLDISENIGKNTQAILDLRAELVRKGVV